MCSVKYLGHIYTETLFILNSNLTERPMSSREKAPGEVKAQQEVKRCFPLRMAGFSSRGNDEGGGGGAAGPLPHPTGRQQTEGPRTVSLEASGSCSGGRPTQPCLRGCCYPVGAPLGAGNLLLWVLLASAFSRAVNGGPSSPTSLQELG